MSIYTNRVQAPVKSVEFTGFEKPLQSFKELSASEIAKKEKERTDQLASQQEKETQERAAQQERVKKQAEAARKEQEKASKEQRKQYMEMSEKVKAPSTLKMYDGHYAMLEDFAQFLANPETIKEYASSVEGEMEFNALIDQLLNLTSTFEGYYNQTYGEFGDPIDAPTWEAAVRRNQEGVKGGDISYDTSYEEMLSRMNKLDSKMHQKMEVRGGRVVFVDNEGNELVPGEDMLDLNVFRSEVSERPPRTGGQYISSVFDPEAMSSPAAVEEQVIAALEDPDTMRDASRTYVEEMMIQNPDFSMTPEEVEANPTHREAAEKLYIKQAQEEVARRQRDRADIPTGKALPDDSVEAQEENLPLDEQPQPEETLTEAQIDATMTEEEEVEEISRAMEREMGRPVTEEEKAMIADPETQALLRAAGMIPTTISDVQAQGRPTSGLEDVNITQTPVSTPESAPAGPMMISDVQAQGRPSSGLEDVNLTYSRPKVSELLSVLEEVPTAQPQEEQPQYTNLTDEEKPLYEGQSWSSEPSSTREGIDQNIRRVSFDRNEGPEVQMMIETEEEGRIQSPVKISSISFDTDRFGWEIETMDGSRQFLPVEGEGVGTSDIGLRDPRTGDVIDLYSSIAAGFNKKYGEGSFNKLLGTLMSQAFQELN